MNRRNFLRILAGTAASPIIAPATKYFFAPKNGWPLWGHWMSVDWGSKEATVSKRMYYINKQGIYQDGLLISEAIPPEAWGLASYQTKPPYISDEYLGISRSPLPIQRRPNKAFDLMDDYARRCGAEWTDKPWT